MISVGSPGIAGSVITDGNCGNGYASLDRVVGVVAVVGVVVGADDVSVSAVGASGVVVGSLDCGAVGATVAALDGRVLIAVVGAGGVLVTGSCGGAP